MVRTHEVAVTGLHGTADKSKRKRKRSAMESAQEHPEATALQHTLNQIKLNSWQYALPLPLIPSNLLLIVVEG